MGRPRLPCEQATRHTTRILIVGAGFAGLAFARVLQWKARLTHTLVTHIEISDEGAVAAGDIKLAGAREVFEACELQSSYARGRCVTYSREFLRDALAMKDDARSPRVARGELANGTVHHGWELAHVEVERGRERVQCTLRHRATGECVTTYFDYVVGADGLCSTVREHARRSPAVAAHVALIGDARRVVLGEPDFGWSRVKYGARQAMLDGAALGDALDWRGRPGPDDQRSIAWPKGAPPPAAYAYRPVRERALRLATRAVALLPLCAVLAATWYGSSHS